MKNGEEEWQVSLEELIETLWNVNGDKLVLTKSLFPELIETLWNVNFVVGHVFYDFVSELIETLWNVNQPLRCAETLGGL